MPVRRSQDRAGTDQTNQYTLPNTGHGCTVAYRHNLSVRKLAESVLAAQRKGQSLAIDNVKNTKTPRKYRAPAKRGRGCADHGTCSP